MDITPIAIYYYQTNAGRCPFKDWFNSLDVKIQQIIDARLTRIRRGLFGHAETLGGGLWEFKFDVGPGYRVYYGKEGKTVVILLCAGHKKSQSSDIATARDFWVDYTRRTKK